MFEQRKCPKKVARRSRPVAARQASLRCSDEWLGCGTRPVPGLRQSSPSRCAGTPSILRYSALSTGLAPSPALPHTWGRETDIAVLPLRNYAAAPVGWVERSEAQHFPGDTLTLGFAALNPTYALPGLSLARPPFLLCYSALSTGLAPSPTLPRTRGRERTICDQPLSRPSFSVERPHVDAFPLQPRRATQNEGRSRAAGWRGLSEARNGPSSAAKPFSRVAQGTARSAARMWGRLSCLLLCPHKEVGRPPGRTPGQRATTTRPTHASTRDSASSPRFGEHQ